MGKGNKSTWVAIGCAVVFAGMMSLVVLAAIAVPSFLKYIKSSKASEATVIASRIATGIQTQYLDTCKFPAPLPPTSAVPTGGTKQLPTPDPGWEKIGLLFEEPLYFSYSTVQVDSETLHVLAKADFDPGGPQHTHIVEMKTTGDCLLELQRRTENEFE